MNFKCPVCLSTSLTRTWQEDGPQSFACPDCGGVLVAMDSYLSWRDSNRSVNSKEAPRSLPSPTVISAEKTGLKFCPGCRHAMRKYRISENIDCHLDRCGNCFSFWMDGNEWILLQELGLLGDIPEVFSADWQKTIRLKESENAVEKLWIERLGKADHARIKELVEWLQTHENKDDLIAYQLASLGLSKQC